MNRTHKKWEGIVRDSVEIDLVVNIYDPTIRLELEADDTYEVLHLNFETGISQIVQLCFHEPGTVLDLAQQMQEHGLRFQTMQAARPPRPAEPYPVPQIKPGNPGPREPE